jgi:hypothetical protein
MYVSESCFKCNAIKLMQLHFTATLQEFEVLTTLINLEDIREKIAMFIVSQIIDQKNKFHESV